MNNPEIYLIEPYNAYAPKRKKHWHEIVEEQALLAKIIAEQQAQQALLEAKSKTTPPQAPPESVPTIVGSSGGAGAAGQQGSAPGGGGTPAWDFFANADTVNFNRTPSSGDAPLTVNFTNLTTTPEFDSYRWEFTMDGVTVTSTDINPVVVFQTGSTNPTVMTASLQATNSVSGTPSGRSPNVYTLVGVPTVTAAFTFVTTSNVAPFSVSFTNTSTNTSQTPSALTYKWTFTYTNAAGAATTTTSAIPTGYSRRVDSGSFTASLEATGSYGIATKYTQSFAAPAPTLDISFTVASSSIYSPSSVTLTPTVTYNGIGTVSGKWYSGEWTEPPASSQYDLPYAGAWTGRLYDTRSAAAVTDGKFTASLSLTESLYGIARLYTQSFALTFPTLAVALATVSSSKYAPSTVTFTPTVTNNGAGTVTGLWSYGEWTEDGTSEYSSPYSAGPDIRTYDTRSAPAVQDAKFTASLGITGSNYGVTAFVTSSFALTLPTVTAAFTTRSFGFGGAEDSYMEPVTMSFTSSTVYLGNGSLTYKWDFGSSSFWSDGIGAQTGTSTTVGPHLRADYAYVGGITPYTASLQVTESRYGIASLYTQSFLVDS